MRRAANVDGNHAEIVSALRSIGATVQSLAAVGDGCPDLLVGFRAMNYLLEIKNPKQRPSARRLRASQRDWHGTWRGLSRVVTSIEEAFVAIGAQVRSAAPPVHWDDACHCPPDEIPNHHPRCPKEKTR